MVASKLVTAAELAEMDSDLRVELMEGELVEMSPSNWWHLQVADKLTDLLKDYARRSNALRVYMGDAGYYLGRNPDTVLAPDIAVVSDEQRRFANASKETFAPIAPLIVVEVRSPSERAAHVARKTGLYLAAGVREVWWVRADRRAIEIHASGVPPRTLGDADTLESPDILPGFRLPLADLFAGD